MGVLGDVFGGIGDFAGLLAGGGADQDKAKYYQQLLDKMGGVDPTIKAQQAAPSDQGAQLDALRELQQIYRSGGLDASSRAGLAEATTSANRTATANRGAVLEGARARGAGRSGVTLALQQGAGQDATGDANMAATEAAGLAQKNRMGAIGGAAEVGGRAAAAQDAINRFNASMRMGAAQSTYGNKMDQLDTEGRTYGGIYDANKAGEARTARMFGSLGRMAGSAGDAIAGDGMPSWLKSSPLGGAAYT